MGILNNNLVYLKMSDLSQPTAELVRSLCSAIATCKELKRLLALLELSSDALLSFDRDKYGNPGDEFPEAIVENLHRISSITDVQSETVKTTFYASSFQEFAETLLTGN